LRQGATINRAADLATARVILTSRVVLAVGGVIAIWVDPTQPSNGNVGYGYLAAYVVFSLALLATFNRPLAGRWNIALHAIEIALVCLIIIYIEGPSSPFFIYFTFLLLVAALRWQGRGALMTGAFLSIVLILLTTSEFVVHFAQADVDRLIVRNIYLIVVSVLFAVFGDEIGNSTSRLARLRLARQLHDSTLQALAATRLKVQLLLPAAQGEQHDRLLEIDQLLNQEQREIRTYVEQSRGDQRATEEDGGTLDESSLQPMAQQLKKLWGCQVELCVAPDVVIQHPLAGAVRYILTESVANAVAHGKSDHVSVIITKDATGLWLKIKDNGNGLSHATGEYDQRELGVSQIGPRSIRERVASLNGSFRLSTSSTGIELQIGLPAQEFSLWA
jgi:signal transduction histidine kinase